MGMGKILWILGLLMAVAASQAQTPAEKISEVKRQGDKYWYAESTGADESATLEKARTLLTDVVRSHLPKGEDPEKLLAEAQGIVKGAQHVVAARGPLKRVFVYVASSAHEIKKAPSIEEEEAIVIDLGASAQPETATMPAKDLSLTPVEEIPATVAEEVPAVTKPERRLSELERGMLGVESAQGIESFLKQKKAAGEIRQFGRLKTMPMSGDLYIFIFNPAGGIEAPLQRKGNEIIRLDDNTNCAIEDFKGCGAIWFK